MKVISRENILLAAAALLLALVHQGAGSSWKDAALRLGIGRAEMEQKIRVCINNYNSASSGMYATAGLGTGAITAIPALNLEKRKLYKDIDNLRQAGYVMVFDRDSVKVTDIDCTGSDSCSAISDEVWGVALQYAQSRQKVYNVKASKIRCRYRLARDRDGWKVASVEVFPPGEAIPALQAAKAL